MMNLYCSLFDQCEVSASQILVTQNDFRQIQLAKAALYAGVKLLLDRAGDQRLHLFGRGPRVFASQRKGRIRQLRHQVERELLVGHVAEHGDGQDHHRDGHRPSGRHPEKP